MRELRDRVAAVTGAASGIGRALAHALAAEGAHLALADIDQTGLEETRATAEKAGVRVSAELVDVADRAAVHAWADRTAEQHGRVNLVVNNAGVAASGTLSTVSYEDLDWLMGIDFWGVVHGTRAFLPHLRRAGEGHVVNLSSVFGLIAVPGQGPYNAAKFAVRGFTECLREELDMEDCGVSATCVHPGGVKTNIVRSARFTLDDPDAPGRDELIRVFDQRARTTPEAAAAKILRGVRRNARRVLIGPDAWLIDRLQRWAPTAYQRLMVRAARSNPT